MPLFARAALAAALAAQLLSAGQPAEGVSQVRAREAPSMVYRPEPGACRVSAPTTAAAYAAEIAGFDDALWAAADQSTSVRLSDGRTAWLYADTMRTGSFVHNSMIIQQRGCFAPIGGYGSDAREVIPNRTANQWYWPMTAFITDSRLMVFSMRVAGGSDGTWTEQGMEIAEFNTSTASALFKRMWPTPGSLSVDSNIVMWGQGVYTEGGYTYIYGTMKSSAPMTFGRDVYLARVRSRDIARTDQWRFWTGKYWDSRESKSAKIISAVNGPSVSLSVIKRNGRLSIISKENDFLGDKVVAWTSPSGRFMGPFTKTTLISGVGSVGNAVKYTAMAHPQLRLASGKLLITLCNNVTGPTLPPPSQYRPSYYEVNWP